MATEKKAFYQTEIQQMMFVFGEVQDPIDESCLLIEDIVKSQLIRLLSCGVAQSAKRGSRFLAPEDLIFLIRHDESKVNRLRSFLSWKDVRKNVKGEKNPSIDEDMLEEGVDKAVKVKKMRVKFSWDHLNHYSSVLEEDEDDDADEEEKQAYEDQINRLRVADQITRNMTKDEYIYYAECRQASFTYKKVKRFKEWCEMGKYYENAKANSDIIDSLGFLCHEAVGRITMTALEIKRKEEQKGNRIDDDSFKIGLFVKPPGEQTPLQPRHIQEAYRILQRRPNPLMNFRSGISRTDVLLI